MKNEGFLRELPPEVPLPKLDFGTAQPRLELFEEFLNYAEALQGKKGRVDLVPVAGEMAVVSQAMMKIFQKSK